jgi:hypothetical protein
VAEADQPSLEVKNERVRERARARYRFLTRSTGLLASAAIKPAAKDEARCVDLSVSLKYPVPTMKALACVGQAEHPEAPTRNTQTATTTTTHI